MHTENRSKVNQLVNQWARGTVLPTSRIRAMGFSDELIRVYRKSKWIRAIGRGAYALYGDQVEWTGGLYALQSPLGLSIHAGGKTALELKGFSHYLPGKSRRVFLYGIREEKVPAWFKEHEWGVEVVYTATNLFPARWGEGFSDFKEKEFTIRIASPERAAMEMLYQVPSRVGFEEAFYIMENLTVLRPRVVYALLGRCNSVKVKRLFMYMAEKHRHPWVERVDTSRVDFGSGKRLIVKSGVLNRKYHITVPKHIEEGTG